MLCYHGRTMRSVLAKSNPFDYVKSINEKKKLDELTGYNPYLTNRCFAGHLDTVLLAEEMNQAHMLAPELQYDFYYYSVRKGKRFGFPPKPNEDTDIEIVMEFYNYSRQKALEALQLLTKEDISQIKRSMDTGGRKETK